MHEAEQAFIREIAADPDNLVPRLIYADWLDDNGDERGEYLRLECRAAVEESEEAEEFQQLAFEMLRQYRSRWVEALGPGVMWYQFRLGLIDEVLIRPEVLLGNNGQVLRQSPLTGLRVRLAFRHLPEFFRLPELGQVRRLHLDYSNIGDAGIKLLYDSQVSTGLRELSLKQCRIGLAGLKLLKHHPLIDNLERLSLVGNPSVGSSGRLDYPLTGKEIRTFFDSLPEKVD